jgi:hypothetical protein
MIVEYYLRYGPAPATTGNHRQPQATAGRYGGTPMLPGKGRFA